MRFKDAVIVYTHRQCYNQIGFAVFLSTLCFFFLRNAKFLIYFMIKFIRCIFGSYIIRDAQRCTARVGKKRIWFFSNIFFGLFIRLKSASTLNIN